MKTACLFLLASSAAAFAPALTQSRRAVVKVFAEHRPDSSQAVADALEASKKYGATSPEARLAWEAVEDMDAADNSAAMVGTLDQECDLTDEEMTAACQDYAAKMEELKSIVGDFQMSKFEKMKALTSELNNLKIKVDTPRKKDTPEVRAAVQKATAAAKKATEEFGVDSQEARVAWAEVEEVAASGLQNAFGPRLDEECLVDTAMEACMALEELDRALKKANIN